VELSLRDYTQGLGLESHTYLYWDHHHVFGFSVITSQQNLHSVLLVPNVSNYELMTMPKLNIQDIATDNMNLYI